MDNSNNPNSTNPSPFPQPKPQPVTDDSTDYIKPFPPITQPTQNPISSPMNSNSGFTPQSTSINPDQNIVQSTPASNWPSHNPSENLSSPFNPTQPEPVSPWSTAPVNNSLDPSTQPNTTSADSTLGATTETNDLSGFTQTSPQSSSFLDPITTSQQPALQSVDQTLPPLQNNPAPIPTPVSSLDSSIYPQTPRPTSWPTLSDATPSDSQVQAENNNPSGGSFTQKNQTDVSPLDNPWGSPPAQDPVTEAGNSNTQVPQPTESTPNISQPTWMSSSSSSTQGVSDNAPTDLSHLISNNPTENPTPMQSYTPAAETLVIPQSPNLNPEVPSVPTGGKGIPKWLIGVGIGLLIVVAATSAYFILGIGRGSDTATSTPAQTTSSQNNSSLNQPVIKTPPTDPSRKSTQIYYPSPTASGSASFGQISGNSSPPPAMSAADLLKQRQQQATASSNP